MALHLDIDLADYEYKAKNNGYKGEIQIVGQDISRLKEVEDFPFSLLAYNMETKLSDRPSYEETIEGISNVKMEDIINVSRLLKIDTIFTLVPGDENE